MRVSTRAASLLLLSCTLIGCGSGIQKVQVKQPKSATVGKPLQHSQRFANAQSAADTALLHRALETLAWMEASIPENNPPPSISGSSGAVTTPPSVTAASIPSSPWDCIAEAETGSDYSMHGSTYSTAFGVINDIVREYGSPEEQAQIFSGTASKETQIAVVSRFANEHGFGGWGVLTKQKCGL